MGRKKRRKRKWVGKREGRGYGKEKGKADAELEESTNDGIIYSGSYSC